MFSPWRPSTTPLLQGRAGTQQGTKTTVMVPIETSGNERVKGELIQE